MPKRSVAESLFPKTRAAILRATVLRPDRAWYLSDLAKELRLTPSSLQRELAGLVKIGVLRRWKEGRRVYFQADPNCAFLAELRDLLRKLEKE